MIRRQQLVCRCADVVITGAAFNLAALIVTPLVRPDLDLFRDSLSYYAVGPWGIVQTAAFAATGLALLALAVAMSQESFRTGSPIAVAALLAFAGVASLGLVAFPMGTSGFTTPIGDLHQTAGTVGGVAQLAATLIFAVVAHGDARWAPIYPLAVIAFWIALIGAILSQLAIWRPDLGIPMGATIRLFVVPPIVLWAVVAWRIRLKCARPFSRSSASM
jgi:hypothetical protein